jgi:hypothetical protein
MRLSLRAFRRRRDSTIDCNPVRHEPGLRLPRAVTERTIKLEFVLVPVVEGWAAAFDRSWLQWKLEPWFAAPPSNRLGPRAQAGRRRTERSCALPKPIGSRNLPSEELKRRPPYVWRTVEIADEKLASVLPHSRARTCFRCQVRFCKTAQLRRIAGVELQHFERRRSQRDDPPASRQRQDLPNQSIGQ